MSSQKLTKKILEASTISELVKNELLPEPNDSGSFFFVYYSRKDYKPALKDIVSLSALDVRIWYDRKQESGKSWESDMLARASDFHCAAVVFYLSENAVLSPFFWRLCALVAERHIAYCSVNLPDEKGKAFSWKELEKKYHFTPERAALAEQLFSEDITYIPHSLSAAEKKIALERIGKNELLIYMPEGDSATVLGVKDLAEEEIIIPEYVTLSGVEYPVRRIAPKAFANCSRLKKIIIPDTVEGVGEFADDIEGTNSVGLAFAGCIALEEIKLPSKMKVLQMNNFMGCESLKRVYIGDNVEKIIPCDNVFDNLEELSLPPIVKCTQEGQLLYFDDGWQILNIYCEGDIYGFGEIELEEKFVPKKGEAVGNLYCNSSLLREVDASNLDDEYFNARFWWCENLEKVTLPEGIKTLETNFVGCTSLSKIDLPQSLETIGPMTFAECNFEELLIPKNVQALGMEVFKDANIKALVSDSKYNDKLFRKSNNYNSIADQLKGGGKKARLLKLAMPFIFLKNLFRLLFSGNLMALLLILIFPVSFWMALHRTGTVVTDGANIERLYLRKGTYKRKPHGWKKVDSNRPEYHIFIRK